MQPPERIETMRLVLRRWQLDDAPRLRAAIDASLPELKPWIPWAAAEPTPMPALVERLTKQRDSFTQGPEFAFAIFDLAESELLGGIGLFARLGPEALEIGYWIRSDAAGRGIATEATDAITTLAQEMGAKHVEIHCDPTNAPSTRVAAKLGYRHARTRLKDFTLPGGETRDSMIWVFPPAAVPWEASFSNVYDDLDRAAAYARLEFPGTYYLAFRDLPAIIAEHVTGHEALDFGCGAGRSTRFLGKLGFKAIGIDISSSMIRQAAGIDPDGDYRCVAEGDFSAFEPARFDLVLSAFAFDNIPGADKRCELLRGLRRLLKDEGRLILLGSTPDIYLHEWASFTTSAFPENRLAKSGDAVRIVMKDVTDARPVVDLVWFHEDYVKLFAAAELDIVARYLPLGRQDEPHAWVTETSLAPWVIYVVTGKRRDTHEAGH